MKKPRRTRSKPATSSGNSYHLADIGDFEMKHVHRGAIEIRPNALGGVDIVVPTPDCVHRIRLSWPMTARMVCAMLREKPDA